MTFSIKLSLGEYLCVLFSGTSVTMHSVFRGCLLLQGGIVAEYEVDGCWYEGDTHSPYINGELAAAAADTTSHTSVSVAYEGITLCLCSEDNCNAAGHTMAAAMLWHHLVSSVKCHGRRHLSIVTYHDKTWYFLIQKHVRMYVCMYVCIQGWVVSWPPPCWWPPWRYSTSCKHHLVSMCACRAE